MKIRGLLAGLLVAVSLAGCSRSATAPEAPAQPPVVAPSFDDAVTPPPDTTTNRGGGSMGTGH